MRTKRRTNSATVTKSEGDAGDEGDEKAVEADADDKGVPEEEDGGGS